MKPEPASKRVLDILHNNHKLTYAVVVDEPDTDPVLVTIAKRSNPIATFQLGIPKEKFDPFKFLDLIEQHQPKIIPLEPDNDPCSF
tara:strand:+ start:1596 stop:1853 length:258 start_codon:yes stop_codon:yes gene_type:complete